MKQAKYLVLFLLLTASFYGVRAEEQVVEKSERREAEFEQFLNIVKPEDIDSFVVIIKVAKDKTKDVNNEAWTKIFEACSEYGRAAQGLNKNDDAFDGVLDKLVDLLKFVYKTVKDEESINGALELRMLSDKFQKLAEDFVKQNELEDELLESLEEE